MAERFLSPDREQKFPKLKRDDYFVTSDEDFSYNCIAHAVGESSEPWWPMEGETEGVFWPVGVPQEETIEAFMAAYRTKDYLPCEETDTSLEPGFEKIVLFVNDVGEPTHAAKQLPSGAWTSKLGYWEDIEHKTLECLESEAYGKVAKVLKRIVQNEKKEVGHEETPEQGW